MDWHDYLRDVKVLLAALLVICLGFWYLTRDAGMFGMAKDVCVAIIALATGTAIARKGNGNGGTDKP